MYKVRQGYVVTHLSYVCRAGTEVPASILKEVLKNQSWKLEEIVENVKKETSKEKEITEGNSGNKEKEEISDLITNRTMTEKETKRKAKE